MAKKLYYQLSDLADVSNIVMDLSGCMKFIAEQMKGISKKDSDKYQYTITPVWLTETQATETVKYHPLKKQKSLVKLLNKSILKGNSELAMRKVFSHNK